MQVPYICTSFLNGFSALILTKKGDPKLLCQQVGIDNQALYDESLLVPFDKFVLLLEAAARQLNFPTVALELARLQDMMILAPLGPMLAKCQNVSDAIQTLLKYLNVIVQGYEVDFRTQNGYLCFAFKCALPQIAELRQFQDYALASAFSILNGLAGRVYPLRACYFTRQEESERQARDYATYFSCPVGFGNRTLSIVVDDAILTRDVQHIVDQIALRIRKSMATLDGDLVEQVKKVISLSLASGISDIDNIASSMGYSARSLQRMLSERGTSFRALLDAVRVTLANAYLKNSYYRLTDIAAMLGYSNLSAFSRSYVRWCGVSPIEARHAQD